MLEKIKQVSWRKWAAMCLIAIFLSILLGFGLSYIENLRYPTPWTNATHISTKIAINEFSGEVTGNTIFFKQRMGALTGILVFLIIGPGLLILCGYESKSKVDESEKNTADWGFQTGLVITLMGLLTFTLQAIVAPIVQANTRTSASRSAKLDELRQNLLLLGYDSFEYMVLPEHRGGGGSFEDLQLQDLPSYNTFDSYHIQETGSDTVLRIIGKGKPTYAIDGEDLEEVKVSVKVRPSKITDMKTLKDRPASSTSLINRINRPLKVGWAELTK